MKILEHNVETNEVIERDMNDTELAQYEIDQAETAARITAQEEKSAARLAILNRLGLTEEEAQLIIGGSN